MGAYLHLRGLAELDEVLHSDKETLQCSDDSGPGASEVFWKGTSGVPTSSGSMKEGDHATTKKMDDCSNFWAGQLDDEFEELPVKKRYQDAATAKMRLNGTQQQVPRTLTERSLDRRQGGDSSSVKSGILQDSCVENRIVDHVLLVDPGSPSTGFHHGVAIASANNACCAQFSNMVGASASGRILGEVEELGSRASYEDFEDQSERLPDHLLIEVLVRVPTRDWPAAACVKKRWAQLFKGDGLWHSALLKKWPGSTSTKRWPGPIARGSSKSSIYPISWETSDSNGKLDLRIWKRYTALYVSDSLFARDEVEGVNEVAGHVYLFLKEQLESPTPPVSYGLLHGTIIDQFLACCKTGDEAHNLASHIWIAVLDNLDESEDTFHLLMRIAEEWEVLLPYPYSKSHAVQWRLFERLFTDFRDCLSYYNYFDVLSRARSKFLMIPPTWLGY